MYRKCTVGKVAESRKNRSSVCRFAMLKGETIVGYGSGPHWHMMVFWDGVKFVATYNGKHCDPPDDFTGFRIVKKRPMTRFEILQWVQSAESNGWLVNIRLEGDTELKDDWQLPSRYKYDNYEDTQDDIYEYVRDPILKDGSGVDKTKIIGFFVEEED
jgi:hypothetical protein